MTQVLATPVAALPASGAAFAMVGSGAISALEATLREMLSVMRDRSSEQWRQVNGVRLPGTATRRAPPVRKQDIAYLAGGAWPGGKTSPPLIRRGR